MYTAPPPEVVASWPRPNYIDPVRRNHALTIVTLVLTITACFAVACRIFSRLFITRAPGLDDLLCVCALAFAIPFSAFIIIGYTEYGIGTHVWDVLPSLFPGGQMMAWASELCYILSSSSIKISILLFYRRLAVSFTKPFFVATWIGIAYNIAFVIAYCGLLLGICQPVEAYWNRYSMSWSLAHPNARCINESSAMFGGVIASVVGDAYSTLLPLVLVSGLQLPRRQKLALFALFAVGFFVVAFASVRAVISYRLFHVTYDVTWETYPLGLASIAEIYAAIICACAPALKPFFQVYFIGPVVSVIRNHNEKENDAPIQNEERGVTSEVVRDTMSLHDGSTTLQGSGNGDLANGGKHYSDSMEMVGIALGSPIDFESRTEEFKGEASQNFAQNLRKVPQMKMSFESEAVNSFDWVPSEREPDAANLKSYDSATPLRSNDFNSPPQTSSDSTPQLRSDVFTSPTLTSRDSTPQLKSDVFNSPRLISHDSSSHLRSDHFNTPPNTSHNSISQLRNDDLDTPPRTRHNSSTNLRNDDLNFPPHTGHTSISQLRIEDFNTPDTLYIVRTSPVRTSPARTPPARTSPTKASRPKSPRIDRAMAGRSWPRGTPLDATLTYHSYLMHSQLSPIPASPASPHSPAGGSTREPTTTPIISRSPRPTGISYWDRDSLGSIESVFDDQNPGMLHPSEEGSVDEDYDDEEYEEEEDEHWFRLSLNLPTPITEQDYDFGPTR